MLVGVCDVCINIAGIGLRDCHRDVGEALTTYDTIIKQAMFECSGAHRVGEPYMIVDRDSLAAANLQRVARVIAVPVKVWRIGTKFLNLVCRREAVA